MEESYEYVVRGAKLWCTCGTHIRKLNLPKDHGVYVRGTMPLIHEDDCVYRENIEYFGACLSEASPAVEYDTYYYQAAYDPETLEIVDRQGGEKVYGPLCQPKLCGKWQNTHDRVYIKENGELKALVTTNSVLSCAHGGKIVVLLSGQESEEGAG